MSRFLWLGSLALLLAAGFAGWGRNASAATPEKGMIWYNDHLVRTLLPPAATPQEGRDAFYKVPGVGGVASVAPGAPGYHGGHWAVWVASGVDAADIAAYGGLDSAAEVLAAATDGAITLTREPEQDFLCPIQP